MPTVVRRTRMMAGFINFTLKTAAKLLQIKTWLLLTAYRNSSSPYPTWPSPTFFFALSHNTCVTDRQTDRRQTHPCIVGATGRPKTRLAWVWLFPG